MPPRSLRTALVACVLAALAGSSGGAATLTQLNPDLLRRETASPLRGVNPSENDGDGVGAAIAMDGASLLVGGPGRSSGRGMAISFVQSPAATFLTRREMFASGGVAGDAFGSAVAIDGDVAVVGAPGRNGSAGAAYVFTRVATNWTQSAVLVPTGAAAGDRFGAAVSVSSGTILVGAPGRGGGAGASFVFTGADATWTEAAALSAPDSVAGDSFGAAVAVDGDVAAVGAPSRAAGAGAAYVFVRDGAAWPLSSTLASPVPGAGRFGAALDADSGRIAVGAPFQFEGNESGAAHVFLRSGNAFELETTIADPSRGGRTMGWSLDLDGDRLALGAPDASGLLGGGGDGSVVLVGRVGDRWTGIGEVFPGPEDAYGDVVLFGSAVGVSANAVVGGSVVDPQRPGGAWPAASRAPAFSQAASASPPAARILDTVRFTAAADDPDGDEIRLVWGIGGGEFDGGDVRVEFLRPRTVNAAVVATDGIASAVSQTSIVIDPVTGGTAAVTLEETYKRKPKKVRAPFGAEVREVDDGTVKLKGTLELPGFDPSALVVSDEFRIGLGEFGLVVPLGADPKWRPGRTKARVRDVGGTTTLDWSSGRLAFSVKSATARRGFTLAGSPVAKSWIGSASGPVSGTLAGAVTFDSHAAALSRTYTATVQTSRKPAPDGDGELTTSTVVVSGK